MNENEETAQLLDKAADILAEGGWCRGASERRGRHCAVGALCGAAPLFGGRREAKHRAIRVLNEWASHTCGGGHTIVYWNDEIAKSGEQVQKVMREVAASLRA